MRYLLASSQCVLQAVLISDSCKNPVSSLGHDALSTLTERTVADRGRLEMIPSSVAELILSWIETQKSNDEGKRLKNIFISMLCFN